MEYMSVKEAAKKWGISERLIQRHCTEERIEGATKFSGAWAIPTDAARPGDLRKEKILAPKPEPVKGTPPPEKIPEKPKEHRHIPMPLLNTPFRPGNCLEAVARIEDLDCRSIALAEYYYFGGQAEKAVEAAKPYLDSEDLALRLSACWISGYANLATGNIAGARIALEKIQKAIETEDGNSAPEGKALAVFIVAAAAVLLHTPLPENFPGLEDYVHYLPIGLRLFALYVQAHGDYLKQNYGESLGIIKTALELQQDTYPIPAIYLHLVATMDYMSLKDIENAKKHLLAAWEIAYPDYLIEAFGEHHGLLGGMLETVIKKDWPEDFKKIITITYRFSAGWRKIHNPETGHDVADNLTTMEFTICMLAGKGWTNSEIGDYLDLSANTIKHHLSVAFQKLGITQRKDLKKYMLN